MTQRSVRKLPLYSLMALLLTAATCPPSPPPVTITYEQVGACNGYMQTTGPGGAGPQITVSAGTNGAFVAFRIISLTIRNPRRPSTSIPIGCSSTDRARRST